MAWLGFLGLGAQPPSPEWGRLLSGNPITPSAPRGQVLAPAAAPALLGVLAVTASGGVRWPRPRRRFRIDYRPGRLTTAPGASETGAPPK